MKGPGFAGSWVDARPTLQAVSVFCPLLRTMERRFFPLLPPVRNIYRMYSQSLRLPGESTASADVTANRVSQWRMSMKHHRSTKEVKYLPVGNKPYLLIRWQGHNMKLRYTSRLDDNVDEGNQQGYLGKDRNNCLPMMRYYRHLEGTSSCGPLNFSLPYILEVFSDSWKCISFILNSANARSQKCLWVCNRCPWRPSSTDL